MSISSNTRLGNYEIRSQIGAGGMGEVYRARDTLLRLDCDHNYLRTRAKTLGVEQLLEELLAE